MKSSFVSCCCAAAVLLYPFLLFAQPAQPTGGIQGTITTGPGEPAAAVVVTVQGTPRHAATGRDGSYRIDGIPEGRYVLRAARVGLAAQEQEADVVAGQTARVDFVLPEAKVWLDEVTVDAARSPNELPATIGKIRIAPMDLPQSVAILDRQLLEERQVLHLGEALQHVNGVYVMGTTGGTQEELAGRGFSLGSSSTFKNGVRFNNGVMPEMSALERVEVLKGSNAILFGNVSAGGVLNLVTKKPLFERGGEISMRAGSYHLYKPAIDLYGPLTSGDHAAYRLNATYEDAGSFREGVGSERLYVNPSLLARFGARTELLVEGDLLKDDRTPDYGTGAIDYAIADVPRTRFLGASWSYNRVEQASATATLTHRLGRRWELRGVGGYQHYESDLFGTTRPNASNQFVRADGTWIRGVQRSRVDERYALAQVDLTGRFATGFLRHDLLVGVDADRYRTETLAFENIARYDTINIFDPGASRPRFDIPAMRERQLTTAPVDRAGVYVQDLVSLADRLKLLAGVRWSYQQTRSEVLTYATSATTQDETNDDAFTPRLGLVYQPARAVALFASYATSFTLNTGVDVAGKSLPPSFIDQHEAGVKTDWFGGLVSANVTAYRIVNSNLAQTSLANGNTNANIKELAGEVTSKGVEVDVATRRTRGVSVRAGYSYNRTTYTESNTYVVGSLLRYNPAHTANASVSYDFGAGTRLEGLNLGAGVVYIGDRVAGRSTRVTVAGDSFKLMPLSGFTQLDLSAGYSFAAFSVRARLSNVFDVLSYYAHDDNSINPIAPRTLSLTTRFRL